ncbi:hypothetical protein GF345_06725 [Candidatus Woesearchaeota archaeon]|nr:hypothetical protein [Candidatus Woesearchaeota archaeon]
MSETKNLNEILRVSQINHKFLVSNLNSNKGGKLVGKWVAVAKKRIFSDTSSKAALKKAKEIEPKREKILLVKVPNKNIHSLRF